jgi:Major tropism determinant N-terminal domain/Collagen triple helix repeat (20 copies)
MANKIQLRRDTAAAWYDANPKLSQGEPGVEIDTGKLKIGDGIAFWRTLPYVNSTELPPSAQGYLANDGAGNLSWTSILSTQGVQGTQGTQGRQGVQGVQGRQGIQGTQGTQGIQGVTGNQGTQGITGDQGTQGITGNQGTQGTQGVTGNQGTQGVIGNQGTQGTQGTQGITGNQGTQGITGSRGDTGLGFTIAKTYSSVAALTADTNPTGIITGQFAIINTSNPDDPENSRLYLWNGSTWDYVNDLSGAAGIQGIQGTQGTQGTTGSQGTQGTQGIIGNQGTQGVQGIIGQQGTQGTQGIIGQQGVQGQQGIQGNQGAQGITGNQGIQGTRGINGSSSSVFDYVANFNQLGGDPGAGHITWDDANQVDSANINISHINSNNDDIDVILSLIDPTQKITVQSKADSSSYQAWLVTGDPINVNPGGYSSYWQIPVTLIGSNSKGNTGFFNQDQLLISITNAATQGTQGLQGAAGGGGSGNGAQGIQGITGPQGPGIYESDTPPSDTDLLWYDTVNGRLYLYYDSSWVDASPKGGGSQGIQGTQGTQAAQGIQGQQGIQGIQGRQGIQGTQAAQGVQGVQGTRAAQDRLVNGVKEVVLGADGNLAAPSGGNITVSGGGKFVGDGSQLTNLTLTQQANIIGSQPNVTLVAGSYNYLFDNTGTFTLPDNGDILMPGANANLTTGGAVFATKFASYTGTWTLATGANTVNFSVPGPGTYTLWVNGNVPSGIVTYTANVVVTNQNVPVLGTSYGWYYAAGAALVLTAIPNQIVGTANNISSAVVSTSTAWTFTFGITNNSGSSQTVNYGYTRLG